MKTKNKYLSHILPIAMAFVLLMTMSVSAFASSVQLFNADLTTVTGGVSYTAQSYSVNVTAPANTSKIEMTATLYQKQLLGFKKIDTMTSSVNSWKCAKSESAAIESGKTYKIEVVAEICTGGVWDTIERELTVKT